MPITLDQLAERMDRDYRAASETMAILPTFIDPNGPADVTVQLASGACTFPTLKTLTAAIDAAIMQDTINSMLGRVDQLDTLNQGVISALNQLGASDGPTWSSYDLTNAETAADSTDPMYRANVESGVRYPFDAYIVQPMDRRNPGDWSKVGNVLMPPHSDSLVPGYGGTAGTAAATMVNSSQYPAFTRTVVTYNYSRYYRWYGYYYSWWNKRYRWIYSPSYYSYYSASAQVSTVTSALDGTQVSQTFQVSVPKVLKGLRLWTGTAGSTLTQTPKLLITEASLGMPDTSKVIGTATVVQDTAYSTGQGTTGASLTDGVYTSFNLASPIYLQANKAYAFVLVLPSGQAYNVWTSANGFSKGGMFYTQDGAMWTQDLAKDVLFSLVTAAFTAGSQMVELNPLSVSGGIASIKNELAAIVPEGTDIAIEVSINDVWRDIEVMDTIDQLPPFTPVRMVVTATVDAAPMVDTVNSRITAFRPATQLRFTGKLREVTQPGAIKVSVAAVGYDQAFHTISFSAKAGGLTINPTLVRPVYGNNTSAQFEVTFALPIDAVEYQINITGNTTLATRVFDITSIVEI